jgi:hypothetical protein
MSALPNKRVEPTPWARLVPKCMSAAHAQHVGPQVSFFCFGAATQLKNEDSASLKRPHHFNLSTYERGEPKTFLFLIHLDYRQAVYAERGGDFAAVMDVMFEYTPDDPLA